MKSLVYHDILLYILIRYHYTKYDKFSILENSYQIIITLNIIRLHKMSPVWIMLLLGLRPLD